MLSPCTHLLITLALCDLAIGTTLWAFAYQACLVSWSWGSFVLIVWGWPFLALLVLLALWGCRRFNEVM